MPGAAIPDVIGNYRIEREVENDDPGLGRIYIGHTLEETKLLPGYHPAQLRVVPKAQSGESVLRRFEREAQILSRLRHRYITRFYEFFMTETEAVLVTEVEDGKSILEMLTERGALPIAEAISIQQYLLEALVYAHGKSVVHRDVKPANLFRERATGVVKLNNFGIGKIRDAAQSSQDQLTKPGFLLGTPHYMSPEQLREPQDADARSDIYSAGVVLYELLTGTLPFNSRSLPRLIDAIYRGEKQPPSSLRPEIDADLEAIVLRAMGPRPHERYQSAREFLEALDKYGRTRTQEAAEPPAALHPLHVRPVVDIESLDGEDYLDFKRDVDAFAKLIAADDVTPPLSIGLFGDWGSGKSFFMRQLRKRIDVLAAESRSREREGGQSAFHSHIVQIEFNAWHYVEANLWASLVEYIFRNLKFAGDNDDDVRERREKILEQLDSAIAARFVAEKNVEQKQQLRDTKAHELELKQHAADATAAKLQRLQKARPWEAVELSPEAQREVDAAMAEVGVHAAARTAASAREVIGELAAIGNRGRVVWNWIWAKPAERLPWLVALLIAPVIITSAVPLIRDLGAFRWLGTAIADVLAIAGCAIAWIRKHRAPLEEALRKIERAQVAIDETMLAVEKQRETELARFEEDAETATKELADAKAELHAAEDEVRKAEQKLADLAPDRQLSRFIADRAASEDYRKLLGVLAMIRNDFEKLSDLLTRQAKYVESPYRIDRIVLYIDDLDRCPPQRVVEVLQAVHLLLAFKLFVVVVGVDARWVTRSLETRHRSLWREAGRRATDDSSRSMPGFGATPEDYLEKIFQVPFWINPMGAAATQDLLRGIVKVRPRNEAPKPKPEMHLDDASVTPGDEVQDIHGQLDDGLVVNMHEPNTERTAPARAGEDEHNPEALQLEPEERDAMEKLAPLILRSPRSVKRFANIYRLVRARIEPSQLPAYLAANGQPAKFEQTLLLLGIICGAPAIAPELFERIRLADGEQSVDGFVQTLGAAEWPPLSAEAVEWHRAVMALSEFASGPGGAVKLSRFREDLPYVSRYSFRLTPA